MSKRAFRGSKQNEAETERARVCHEKLLKRYLESGYIPYRLDGRSMGNFLYSPDFHSVCRDIKKILDPRGIFAPGHYGL